MSRDTILWLGDTAKWIMSALCVVFGIGLPTAFFWIVMQGSMILGYYETDWSDMRKIVYNIAASTTLTLLLFLARWGLIKFGEWQDKKRIAENACHTILLKKEEHEAKKQETSIRMKNAKQADPNATRKYARV